MRHRTKALLCLVPLLGTTGVIVTASAANAAVAGPTLTVDVAAGRHAISPDIYGMNFADEALAGEFNLPLRRWGGNATTLYDYAADTTNRGSDWYFENVPGNADPAQLPNGSETDAYVDQDRRTGTKTVLTLPLIGWKPNRDYACAFSVAKYGTQQQTDAQWRPDCGNGVKPDGSFITGNDPHDIATEIGTAYVTSWLGHLTSKYGTAANGGVAYYNLDNEPDIWHSTHRAVHPAGASYDEMRDKTYAIGAAVKAADPSAKTLGPVGWGWSSLTLSGSDQETCGRIGGSCWSNPPDRAAHGGVDFNAWYLAQMKAYEQAHGVRILDYYDNHWYPQGSGLAFGNGNDQATNDLRLRSTRNLWDPTYTDESWINTQTQLIPRMKSVVAANYPGTKTAITEYNWGALDHINGALAQADVLGIFGREGLDLATLWTAPGANQPGAFAFRMYLNYDGAGARFGDTGVKATSADQGRLSVYAAQRGSDTAVTMVVVNKTAENLTSSLSVAGTGFAANRASVYRYSPADLTRVVREADATVLAPPPSNPTGPLTIPGTYPANSITTVVLNAPPPDTTAPTLGGPATISNITSTGFTATWPAGSDNVGITNYELQLLGDGAGQRFDVGNVLTHTFTGLNPGGRYGVGLRARDAAGNWSVSLAQPILVTLPSGLACTATYKVTSSWNNGFVAEVTVRNTSSTTLHGWTVRWVYPSGQKITQLWNGQLTQNGAQVQVRDAGWNATIAPRGSTTFGFTGSLTGPNVAPTPTCTSP